MNRRITKTLIVSLFVIYCLMLAYFLFFYSYIRMNPGWSYISHLKRSINIIPLKTIIGYIDRLLNNSINISSFIVNIVGNVIAFFPMGVLLPCMFKKFNDPSNRLIIGIIVIVFIEILQLLSMRGSFDIDDILLNLLGYYSGISVYKTIKYKIKKRTSNTTIKNGG